MNNTNNSLNTTSMDVIIQEFYDNYLLEWFILSYITLSGYAALLTLAREIEHIWLKPFSLPTWLYIFARYGNLALGGTNVLTIWIQTGTISNIICNATNVFSTVAFIGVQGLLIARSYALYQGKILATALALSFLSNAVLSIYQMIAFGGCFISVSTSDLMLTVIGDVCLFVSDILVFGVCIWKVWGTWKLKREANIQTTHSLVSVLINQIMLRFCFVIFITITSVVLIKWYHSSVSLQRLSQGFGLYQNALSSILVADFTLDLRSLNSAKIEVNNSSLPSLRISNVLHHMHQSIIVELSTPEDAELEGNSDHDNPGTELAEVSAVLDIQPA